MHRRRVPFRVLKSTRSVASAARPQLSWQRTAQEVTPPVDPHPSKWSHIEPSKSHSRSSHPPTGTSLLTRASATTKPLRAPPSKVSTSRWSPPTKTKPSDPPSLTRSARRESPYPTPSSGESTRPADVISFGVAPRPSLLRPSSFARDGVPHISSLHERRGPFPSNVPVNSTRHMPSTTDTVLLQQSKAHSDPQADLVLNTFPDTDAILESTDTVTPSSPQDLPGRERLKRPNKRGEFKERGSLLRSSNASIPSTKQKPMARWQQLEQKKDRDREKKKRETEKQNAKADLYIPTVVTVGQFARLLNVRLGTLQRKMIQAGMPEDISHDHVLTSDYTALLAEEFGRNPIINDEAAFDIYPPPPHPAPHLLPFRPPVVAIMGHVDHGKTTLLDTLRSSSVAASEVGGITQHIGAFCVPVRATSHSLGVDSSHTDNTADERVITFLDTPGHAAFSAMRARGTSVTDIVVLVVAADDGVMPQTLEVIDLVNRERDKGNIGMVVAINKVDKPEADVERTKQALLAAGVPLEEFGGDVPCVEVSGLLGRGLPSLIETLALMADLMDLRADRGCSAVGYVLESKVQKGLGPVATVLVSRGTLKPGTPLLAGTSTCSSRQLLSATWQPLASAEPGTPVLVTGWKSLPAAGEEVLAGSEGDIKRAKTNRLRKKDVEGVLQDVEAINAARKAGREKDDTNECNGAEDKSGGKKELRLVIKGDVSGSVEALVGALEGIGNHLAGVRVVSTGVGDVTESDVMLAKTANAQIIAFSVSCPRSVQSIAAQNYVTIHSSDIIYRVMDHVRDCVVSLLPCTYETKVVGEATVVQLFDIHMKGNVTKKIAGCRVGNGTVEKSCIARVIREGREVHEGPLDALRQLRKEVQEVRKGFECGINLRDFDDLREGDLIQMVKTIEIPGAL
ncbi:hypothetical protein ID866_4634 [Astraeus odoratus]|nr:hypothetical protein ID866_4634 [Astraeus odoratus]